MSRNPTETETISAADFAEMLRTQGTDLRRLDSSHLGRRTEAVVYDPADPRLWRDVQTRLGTARAVQAGGLVGLAVAAREVGDFCPTSHADGTWLTCLHMDREAARTLGRQLLLAADQCPFPGSATERTAA